MSDDVTPATFKEAVGNEKPEATEPVKPEEVTPKEGEQPPEKPTEEVKVEPSNPPQEHDWKKRFDGVDKAHKQLSEEHQQLIDANVKLVEKNPDLIEDLAETNPKLADEVSKKLHGKPYKEYQSAKELESMKEDDPDGYKQEVRLRTLEERESKRLNQAREDFLKSKGIKDNEFDPSFKKVQEQVELLSPKFVEEHPERAWEIAYGIAFPNKGTSAEEIAKAAHLASNTSKSGGMSSVLDHKQTTLNPAAQAFRNKMSELTGK